jgi:hypothetical protein
MFGSTSSSFSPLSLSSQPLFSFPPLPSPPISSASSSSSSSMGILFHPDSDSDNLDVEDSKVPSPARSSSPTFAVSPPGELTQDSNLNFDSYASLRSFLSDYALRRGFDLRWKVRGGETKPVHGGSVRCWCEEKEGKDQSKPSQPEPVAEQTGTRRRRSMWVERKERVRCGCNWRVNFIRHEDRKYVITGLRVLVHNGHEVKPAILSRPSSAR